MNDPDDTPNLPGSRHRALTDAGVFPDLICCRCSQAAFILHHAIAPAPTLLECSCCGSLLNIGLLHYMYPGGVNPDVLMERERCEHLANNFDTGSDLCSWIPRHIAAQIRGGK